MPFRPTRSVPCRLAAAAALATALGACASDAGKPIAEATGLATTAQESKPFVRQSRRSGTDYIPIGTVADRTAPRKPVEEFRKLEAGLEARRQSNEAAGNRARALSTTPAPEPATLPSEIQGE